MKITIKYKDILGADLKATELTSAGNYYMEHYLDGELKRIDEYEANRITDGTYYLSPEEDLQTVLLEVQDVWRFSEFYTTKQVIGNYTVWDREIYKALTKVEIGKTVFDDQGREIAIQYLDIDTLQIIKVYKIHHLLSFGSFIDAGDVARFGTLDFTYDLYDNKRTVEINLPGFENDLYYLPQNNILSHPMIVPLFKWNEYPYYHGALPLLPNGNV